MARIPAPLAARLRRARGKTAARRRPTSAPRKAAPQTSSPSDRKKAARAKKLADIARCAAAPVKPRTIFYESFGGNGALCNPRSMFEHLVADPAFHDYEHVWVLQSGPEHDGFRKRCESLPNLVFVRRGTVEYFHRLLTAQYVISNSAFPLEYSKPAGQVYVNTWHGIPLKTMGYDLPGGAVGTRNVVRTFLAADYLLSSGPSMTQTMYRDAFQLGGLYQGTVIETGLPRMAGQAAVDPYSVRRSLRNRGLRVREGRSLVLFAPTWRGESTNKPENDVGSLRSVVHSLRESLGEGCDVLLKVHQFVYKQGIDDPELADALVPNDVNTNELLAAVDVLITDYSSVFFDYLAEDRPLVFYVPDSAEYQDGRGLYYSLDSLPGECSDCEDELLAAVQRAVQGTQSAEIVARRRDWATTHVPYSDTAITQRVVDTVFREKTADTRLVTLRDPERKRILVRSRSLKDPTVGRDVINVVRQSHLEDCDITLSFPPSKDEIALQTMQSLEDHCRLLPTAGARVVTSEEADLIERARQLGRRSDGPNYEHSLTAMEQLRLDAALTRDWRRLFGDVDFDAVIDLRNEPMPQIARVMP
ncbi:CDP-glycerol glycerophosphotransferase family protein [Brevibacterium yomogidense]|uniref:CDP-glycerol glycerophosphotransferase family protein n=1 Tax=Brevibacterium yomogidense TaxID=946573 RepID=UPI001E38EDB1|nr:CDP-glycerol glycerophosphotransferase family protein [Brevibacterium yomogidense]